MFASSDVKTIKSGVSDGIRTRDVQIHSLALYQAELRSPQEVLCGQQFFCNIVRHAVSTRVPRRSSQKDHHFIQSRNNFSSLLF